MKKPKLLYLTKVGKAVNEKGRARIDMALDKEKKYDSESTSGVINKAWFIDQGLQVPPEYQNEEDEPEIDEDGFINLDEDELEDTYSQVVLNYEDFGMVVDGDEFTTVYTKSGMYVEIYETARQVNKQIKKLFKTC